MILCLEDENGYGRLDTTGQVLSECSNMFFFVFELPPELRLAKPQAPARQTSGKDCLRSGRMPSCWEAGGVALLLPWLQSLMIILQLSRFSTVQKCKDANSFGEQPIMVPSVYSRFGWVDVRSLQYNETDHGLNPVSISSHPLKHFPSCECRTHHNKI